MSKQRPTSGVQVNTRYATCQVFSTQPMQCPLCHVDVPPNTVHECSKPEKTS